jgi:transaldolase
MVLNSEGIRLFLDTADVSEWKKWLPTGLFYGVTTNPLLLEQAQIPCSIEQLQELAHEAFGLGIHEVHLQTWGSTVATMIKTGALMATDYPGRPNGTIDKRVVIKVPVTKMGSEVAARLVKKRIRVTLTGVYATHQVLIAAALGTDYAAPYLGRISDLGQNGRAELVAMRQAIVSANSPTRILVASIRSVEDVSFLATQGLNTFTLSPEIAEGFFAVAATNQAALDFERAAQASLKNEKLHGRL